MWKSFFAEVNCLELFVMANLLTAEIYLMSFTAS